MSRKTLALSICVSLYLVSLASLSYVTASANYDVYVLFHEGTNMENIRYMLNDLGGVGGVAVMVNLYDNTTEAMDEAVNRLKNYLSNLTEYKVIVQAIYCFPYGYMTHHWQFEISSFSEEFYAEWYGKLNVCLANHSNVKLFVGFNEAYFCFENKSDAFTLMQREYTTWKSISAIPFSCEITFPFDLWHNYFNVTNPNFETDVLPIWQNYSDYIGLNLIAYRYPPNYGVDPEGYNRTKNVVSTALYYSTLYNKPIHVNEVLCWYPQDFQHVADNLMLNPHITAIYKLWDWSNTTEAIYALYNINPETGNITRVSPTWQVYQQIINPTVISEPLDPHKKIAVILFAVAICFWVFGYFFRKMAE